MKLFSLFVLYKKVDAGASAGGQAKILKYSADLASFGFFQRSSVEEFMKFTSRIIVERTEPGNRSSIKEQEYMAHVFVRSDGLSSVLISDQEYPNRVAHSLLNKVYNKITFRFSTKLRNMEFEPLTFLYSNSNH